MLDEKYLEKLIQEINHEDEKNIKRTQKLKHYLDERDFGDFIGRIIREHDNNYRDKCYRNGCQPYPNNKFELLLKLVEIEGEEIEEIDFKDTNFPNSVTKYNNYYFQHIWGQGVNTNIYDENHEKIFSI